MGRKWKRGFFPLHVISSGRASFAARHDAQLRQPSIAWWRPGPRPKLFWRRHDDQVSFNRGTQERKLSSACCWFSMKMIKFNDSVTYPPSYLSELSFLSEPGVCSCPVLIFNPLLEKTDSTNESKARLIDIGCQRKCSGSETSGYFSSFEPAGTSRPKEDASGRKTKAGTIFHHYVNMRSSVWTQWHACFYNSWRMYGNAQTAWIQRWRFWGDIDVNWSLLQRAGKTPLLQSITSLPFGTTLLITVKHGTEDERGWTETQTQSQGVHETPSDTATYCKLRLFAIQRIVKL